MSLTKSAESLDRKNVDDDEKASLGFLGGGGGVPY
jgi:hypothetical protein